MREKEEEKMEVFFLLLWKMQIEKKSFIGCTLLFVCVCFPLEGEGEGGGEVFFLKTWLY